ncbi:SUMF1/EgtB/PvdO family nonheme iron enzyme [Pseudoalteromonas sp. Of7M-16]|uniref:SUMF1/EgtB/PvdO family nonheme iron enzyme n=1 Tax=Pseudoalteromonas sp. Of7M-16 TaxID=2917756 RepID=UPI001EF6AB48|nr:SUMF1/EgtB/PvdO family nonheme iron enzyme [Pseudoalteromonas sp. Of7M-16]MCG7550418.1 formylglycine-generating enzyme family protein [Pseudoalteromonas sp. Of7M-16]
MSTDTILTRVAEETANAVVQLNDVTESIGSKIESISNKAKDSINYVNQHHATKLTEIKNVASDSYRQSIEDMSGGKNTVVYDAQGNVNIMVRIPRFNYEDINEAIFDKYGVDLKLGTGTPTMFMRNGEPLGEVLIAKYLASSGQNGGCSVVGGKQPLTSISYDSAKNMCANKGTGWHMLSAHEWAAIALWSLANDTIPRGNTNYGRSHERKLETARRDDNAMPGDASGSARTDTGKGPVGWTHDHTEWGIHDLVGNVWEWLDQLCLVDGQIISTLDNNPDIAESSWFKHSAFFDSPSNITDGAEGAGSPVLSDKVTNRNGPMGDDTHSNPYLGNPDYSSISKAASYVPNEALRRLLIESETQNVLSGALYCRNYGNRFPLRGGDWSNGNIAGLGAISFNYSRTGTFSGFGFRPALLPAQN